MAHNEGPYDPHISSDRDTHYPNAQHAGGNDRTEALQAQINDTVNVMKQNIQRTSERGGRLDETEDRVRHLGENADQFKRGTNRLRKKFVWKDRRMTAWIALGVIITLAIIIAIGVHFGKK